MARAMRILPNYGSALARIFSPIVMDSLIDSGYSRYLNDALLSTGILKQVDTSMRLGKFLDVMYSLIAESHRSEYIYKNAIANKILLGKYSLNTACMLTEFRVGKCKADVVILNRTSTTYEIKSEFDSFDRVAGQVESYTQVFDLVNVITSHSQLAKLESLLPREVGLMELTDAYTIRTAREPISMKRHVKPKVIFDALRKPEHLRIIKKVYGYVPDVPNTRMYAECRNLFSKLAPELAHDEMVRVLSQRPDRKALAQLIDEIPSSLNAYVLSAALSRAQATRLKELMRVSLGAILLPL